MKSQPVKHPDFQLESAVVWLCSPRYGIVDVVFQFYRDNPGKSWRDFQDLEYGPTSKNTVIVGTPPRYSVIMSELETLGFTHDDATTWHNGGDNDYMAIDLKNRQYAFCEQGFSPILMKFEEILNEFELGIQANHDTWLDSHDLEYHAIHHRM